MRPVAGVVPHPGDQPQSEHAGKSGFGLPKLGIDRPQRGFNPGQILVRNGSAQLVSKRREIPRLEKEISHCPNGKGEKEEQNENSPERNPTAPARFERKSQK